MNKLQFQKELLDAVLLLTDTKKIKEIGEQIVKYQTLTAEKKAESEGAQKVIDDSLIAIGDLKKEQANLDALKQFQQDLYAQEAAINAKKAELENSIKSYKKDQADFKISITTFAKKESTLAEKEKNIDLAQKNIDGKIIELKKREEEIRNREDAHKKFIASVS